MADWRALERPPWPLWMLICVVLDKHGDNGLSVEKCARLVRELSGDRYARQHTVRATLRLMRECGYASMELVRSGDRVPTKLHRLTPRGTARLLRALEDVADAYAHLGIRYN